MTASTFNIAYGAMVGVSLVTLAAGVFAAVTSGLPRELVLRPGVTAAKA